MAEPVTGIILAGGNSRRMGRDKAFLPWGDVTLLQHVVDTLRPITDELIVAVNDLRPFRHLTGVNVVADLLPGAHALGGLYTGLRAASNDRCFVCGCDAPFLNTDLVCWLNEQLDGFGAVIPRSARGLEPLHAIYATAALPTIEKQLHGQQRDLQALIPQVCAKIIEAGTVHRFDPDELSFFNVNTPQDLAQALAIQLRVST